MLHKKIFSKKISCVLKNCHESCQVNTEITQYLRHEGNLEYIAFLTEMGLACRFEVGPCTPRTLPYTNNTFYHSKGGVEIPPALLYGIADIPNR